MTHEERVILENAKVAYLGFIKYVKKLKLDKARVYLDKKNAEHGLCAYLFFNKLHRNDFKFIYHEMERIGRLEDYKVNNIPYNAVNKEQLIERLQYRVDLINQILVP